MEALAHYHYSGYCRFNGVAQTAIIDRFNAIVRTAHTRCWYDAEYDRFRLECPREPGPALNDALDAIIADYSKQDLEKPFANRTIRYLNELDNPVITTPEQYTSPTINTNTIDAYAKQTLTPFHVVHTAGARQANLKLFRVSDLPDAISHKFLVNPAENKTIGKRMVIRAVCRGHGQDTWRFNGSVGTPLKPVDTNALQQFLAKHSFPTIQAIHSANIGAVSSTTLAESRATEPTFNTTPGTHVPQWLDNVPDTRSEAFDRPTTSSSNAQSLGGSIYETEIERRNLSQQRIGISQARTGVRSSKSETSSADDLEAEFSALLINHEPPVAPDHVDLLNIPSKKSAKLAIPHNSQQARCGSTAASIATAPKTTSHHLNGVKFPPSNKNFSQVDRVGLYADPASVARSKNQNFRERQSRPAMASQSKSVTSAAPSVAISAAQSSSLSSTEPESAAWEHRNVPRYVPEGRLVDVSAPARSKPDTNKALETADDAGDLIDLDATPQCVVPDRPHILKSTMRQKAMKPAPASKGKTRVGTPCNAGFDDLLDRLKAEDAIVQLHFGVALFTGFNKKSRMQLTEEASQTGQLETKLNDDSAKIRSFFNKCLTTSMTDVIHLFTLACGDMNMDLNYHDFEQHYSGTAYQIVLRDRRGCPTVLLLKNPPTQSTAEGGQYPLLLSYSSTHVNGIVHCPFRVWDVEASVVIAMSVPDDLERFAQTLRTDGTAPSFVAECPLVGVDRVLAQREFRIPLPGDHGGCLVVHQMYELDVQCLDESPSTIRASWNGDVGVEGKPKLWWEARLQFSQSEFEQYDGKSWEELVTRFVQQMDGVGFGNKGLWRKDDRPAPAPEVIPFW